DGGAWGGCAGGGGGPCRGGPVPGGADGGGGGGVWRGECGPRPARPVAHTPLLAEREDDLQRETVRLRASRLPARDRRRAPAERVGELRLRHVERVTDGANDVLCFRVHEAQRSKRYARELA